MSTEPVLERIQLNFYVEPRSWEGCYDRLEVWRSRSTALGPYTAFHDDTWAPARLPAHVLGDQPPLPLSGPSVPLVGKTVTFLLNERTPIEVTFTGTDPVSYEQAATQIELQSSRDLVSFVVPGGVLVVQTSVAGAAQTLRCTGGDAAPLLGLSPYALAFGRDARIVLKHGELNYGFVDLRGSSTFFYRMRFFSSADRSNGTFTAPIQGGPVGGLAIAALCHGYVNLVDMIGQPIENQQVVLYPGANFAGYSVTGAPRTLLTDKNGHADIALVRGTQVTLALMGTNVVRALWVPTDLAVESFNMLVEQPHHRRDTFTVQVPNLPYAAVRSL